MSLKISIPKPIPICLNCRQFFTLDFKDGIDKCDCMRYSQMNPVVGFLLYGKIYKEFAIDEDGFPILKGELG